MSSNLVVQEAGLATESNAGYHASAVPDSPQGSNASRGIWLARAFLVCIAGILAWYTWGHWGDFQIDNGREIYVPVSILQGKMLFRDLCYMYGPLAPYVQAFLMRIFGIHLTVLYLFGLGLTIGAALFTFEIGRQFHLEIVSAAVPPLVFLVQAFHPFIFNFVFPYSYAASLASFLGLGCVYFAIRHGREGRPAQLAMASLLAALVVLTKQEFGIACLAVLAVEVAGRFLVDRSGRNLGTNVLVCAGGLLPALAVYGWFVWKLSAKLIFFDNWISTPGTFFMRNFGKITIPLQGFRFHPGEILQSLGVLALTFVFWFGLAAANAAAVQKWKTLPRIAAMVLLLDLLVAGTAITGMRVGKNMVCVFLSQTTFPPGLFFAGLFFTVWAGWKLWRDRVCNPALPETLLGLYAILASLRVMMELRPSTYNYAVFFNTPVFLIFTILIARVVRSRGKLLPSSKRATFVSSTLAGQAALLVIVLLPNIKMLPAPFTTEFGTFYTRNDVAVLFPQIISFMKSHTRNARDILVLPEPPSLYVFAHMQSPTQWYSVLPGMVDPDHEREFIKEAVSNDVRYILISNRTVFEYGAKKFGIGYDETIYRWIGANFSKVGQFGPQPNSFPFSYVVYVFERKDLQSVSKEAAGIGTGEAKPRLPTSLGELLTPMPPDPGESVPASAN